MFWIKTELYEIADVACVIKLEADVGVETVSEIPPVISQVLQKILSLLTVITNRGAELLAEIQQELKLPGTFQTRPGPGV